MMGPVYVITDAAAPLPVVEQARLAAKGGAGAVQLRDKTARDSDLAALVTLLLPEMSAMGVRLIVNDRVAVAVQTGAHGLHIGQGDGDPCMIRQRIGPDMILGLSVETPHQAGCVPNGVDYIGAGPVRATATKPDHAPPIGFGGLAAITQLARLPVYAIGGIGAGDAAAIKGTGASGMAVVSAVTRAPNPETATKSLLHEWRSA